MKKKCILIIVIVLLTYCFTYRTRFSKKSNIKVSFGNTYYRINATTSYSYAKWGHSYYTKDNAIYLSIFLYPFYNFFINNSGIMYNFYIEEDPNQFHSIYIIDSNGKEILIYTR